MGDAAARTFRRIRFQECMKQLSSENAKPTAMSKVVGDLYTKLVFKDGRRASLTSGRTDIQLDVAQSTVYELGKKTDARKRVRMAFRLETLLLKSRGLKKLTLSGQFTPRGLDRKIQNVLTKLHNKQHEAINELLERWELILPPFKAFNLKQFEWNLARAENYQIAIENAIQMCENCIQEAQELAASRIITQAARNRLKNIGFYNSTKIELSPNHRGVIPGL